MVMITFPDRETELSSLGFLMKRFSGRVLKGGVHIVPDAAIHALAERNVVFNIERRMTESEVETFMMMRLAETAFEEWNEEGEDIYDEPST